MRPESVRMNDSSRKLLILGAGLFAEDIADMVTECGYEIAGFVESRNPEVCRKTLFDNKKIYWIDDIAELSSECTAICALGTTFRDQCIQQAEQMGFSFTTFIHPSARVSSRCSIETGTIISAGAMITAGVRIGRHVLVNRGALIGHHVEIGDFTTLGPGVNIGGGAKIKSQVYLGMGSIIRNNCTIGKHSVVGAGAVVVKDVPEQVEVMGIPACIQKENIRGL